METSISALTFGVVHFAAGARFGEASQKINGCVAFVRVWEETANPSSNLAVAGPADPLGQQGKKMLPGKSSW